MQAVVCVQQLQRAQGVGRIHLLYRTPVELQLEQGVVLVLFDQLLERLRRGRRLACLAVSGRVDALGVEITEELGTCIRVEGELPKPARHQFRSPFNSRRKASIFTAVLFSNTFSTASDTGVNDTFCWTFDKSHLLHHVLLFGFPLGLADDRLRGRLTLGLPTIAVLRLQDARRRRLLDLR